MFRPLGDVEAMLVQHARYYYYYRRVSGKIGWLILAERFDGIPFTDRGFDNLPALSHVKP